MAMRIIVAGALLLCVGTCTSHPQSDTAPPELAVQWFTHPALGVSFPIAESWNYRTEGSAVVFSGPAPTPSFYTTIALQGLSRRGVPTEATAGLLTVLDRVLAPLTVLPKFAWRSKEPSTVGGCAAMRYTVQVELHETTRLRTGVLVDSGRGAWLDLAYAAPEAFFAESVDVFDNAVENLTVFR